MFKKNKGTINISILSFFIGELLFLFQSGHEGLMKESTLSVYFYWVKRRAETQQVGGSKGVLGPCPAPTYRTRRQEDPWSHKSLVYGFTFWAFQLSKAKGVLSLFHWKILIECATQDPDAPMSSRYTIYLLPCRISTASHEKRWLQMSAFTFRPRRGKLFRRVIFFILF